jgi:hypothetical protein
MRKIIIILLSLFSIHCFSQVYGFDKKQIRLADSWEIKEGTGFVVLNNHEIAIAENNVILGFTVDKIKPFGEDYIVYYCTGQDNKKVRFLTVGQNKNKKEFLLIYSAPSIYWKINLVKIE